MPARLLHPIGEACEMVGIGRSTIYELIATGTIETVKIGRRTFIAHAELERFVDQLQAESVGSRDGAA